MTTIPNGWNLKPSVMITIICLLFGIGGASYVTVWRVEALEIKQKDQERHQVVARERLGKIETHMDYAREDLKEIKDLVKTLNKKLDLRFQKEK